MKRVIARFDFGMVPVVQVVRGRSEVMMGDNDLDRLLWCIGKRIFAVIQLPRMNATIANGGSRGR